jgi:hypothetical protein
MKLKKKVFDIVGEGIKKFGFVYLDDPAYRSGAAWSFARDVGNIKQIITVMKDRFSGKLNMDLRTTAWRSEWKNARHIIPKEQYHVDAHSGWPYQNEEELDRALNELLEIIEKYGLDELARLSIEDEVIPTVNMGEKLFSSYNELSEQFVLRHNIDITDTSKENITKWFDVIEQEIIDTQPCTYKQAQDMLVEIAAFLGVQLTKELGGVWVKNVNARGIWIGELNAYICDAYWPLADVIEAWKNRDVEYLKEDYFIMLDAKMPLTVEQMIEFKKKLALHRSNRRKV